MIDPILGHYSVCLAKIGISSETRKNFGGKLQNPLTAEATKRPCQKDIWHGRQLCFLKQLLWDDGAAGTLNDRIAAQRVENTHTAESAVPSDSLHHIWIVILTG